MKKKIIIAGLAIVVVATMSIVVGYSYSSHVSAQKVRGVTTEEKIEELKQMEQKYASNPSILRRIQMLITTLTRSLNGGRNSAPSVPSAPSTPSVPSTPSSPSKYAPTRTFRSEEPSRTSRSETPSTNVPAGNNSASEYTANITYGGINRTYDVHIPPSYDNGTKPMPLVLILHGGGDLKASASKSATDMIKKSNQEGFIAVFPHAINGGWWSWGYLPVGLKTDDVGYIKAVIAQLKNQLKTTQLFIAGGSDGGMMAYRVASQVSGISAVAVVSGTAGGYKTANASAYTVPRPARPVSMIIMHGKSDPLVPYYGGNLTLDGKVYNFMSAPNSVKLWVGYNNATTTPKVQNRDNGYIKIETYDSNSNSDDGDVVFYTLYKSGHDWPGSYNDSARQLSATNEIWNFFKKYID